MNNFQNDKCLLQNILIFNRLAGSVKFRKPFRHIISIFDNKKNNHSVIVCKI